MQNHKGCVWKISVVHWSTYFSNNRQASKNCYISRLILFISKYFSVRMWSECLQRTELESNIFYINIIFGKRRKNH